MIRARCVFTVAGEMNKMCIRDRRHVTALRPERHLDGVGQLVDAGSKRAARVGFELNLFSHIAHILST